MAPVKIGIVVGEASGDILGAALIKALKKIYPAAEFCGIGGPLMLAEGFQSFFPQDRLAVMGLIEPIPRIPELLRIRKFLIQHFSESAPAVFIGIDSPDFNLKIEEKLREKNIKTVHYVSPSVWAWRRGRIKKIKRAVDLMLTLLPFETDIYKQHKIPVEFIGHHLADEIPMDIDVAHARKALGFTPEHKLVALLPGSREGEVKRMGELFFEVARLCQKQVKNLQFIVPAATEARYEQINQQLNAFKDLPIKLVQGNSQQVMAAADVVLMASGTTTLEAMLLKKPMVVAYKMAGLTFAILSRLITVPFVSLPNLLANKELVPELLQDNATPENLSAAVLDYFNDADKVKNLKQVFYDLHQQLRRNASVRAANAIHALIVATNSPTNKEAE